MTYTGGNMKRATDGLYQRIKEMPDKHFVIASVVIALFMFWIIETGSLRSLFNFIGL